MISGKKQLTVQEGNETMVHQLRKLRMETSLRQMYIQEGECEEW